MKYITGGVCAAKGFKAAGIHAGIRKNTSKKDLALIVSEVPCSAAAVYTTNTVKGAPIFVTQRHIENGIAQGVIVNSGNANTCNFDGEEIAEEMASIAAKATGLAAEDFVVASTGVIGQRLSLEPIKNSIDELAASLACDSAPAAEAIMTTDTVKKEVAVEFEVGGKTCAIGGIAKGSGMIHPNMATMLVFITTDAAISADMLKKALSEDVPGTFNMISVDGDTSTNDTACVLANGAAGNDLIAAEGADFDAFKAALNMVTTKLCAMIAQDGEGATKLVTVNATGAESLSAARIAARAVAASSLVKAAMFGADANWGRVLCAIGYSGANIPTEGIDVSFISEGGRVDVCRGGAGIEFSEELAKEVLTKDEIEIAITLGKGEYSATAWGCDLTYDYVKINGDYRT